MKIVEGKPHIDTGGQIVLVTDVGRIIPRDYLQHHKLNEKKALLKKEWQNKMHIIWDNLKLFIFGCKQNPSPYITTFFL